MCLLSIKAYKPILVVTQNKIMNLRMILSLIEFLMLNLLVQYKRYYSYKIL